MSDNEPPEQDLDRTESLKRLPWRTCSKVEARPYWLKTVVAVIAAMGTTKTSFYEQCFYNPKFPRWLVEGQFYFDPFEVGLWCATNTNALQEQEYAKRFIDPKYSSLKSKEGRKIAKVEAQAADQFDREWDLEDSSTSKHPEIIRQKIRAMTIAGDIKQIELDKEKSILVSKKKYEEDEAARITMFKNRFLGMPSELAGRLEQKMADEVQLELDTHIRNIWEQITNQVMETPVDLSDLSQSEDNSAKGQDTE